MYEAAEDATQHTIFKAFDLRREGFKSVFVLFQETLSSPGLPLKEAFLVLSPVFL